MNPVSMILDLGNTESVNFLSFLKRCSLVTFAMKWIFLVICR